MNLISILIGFLHALISDNARLYWYVPVHKALPYEGIRVELYPYMLLRLIDTPLIPVIFRAYKKGLRFASITGDRLIAKLIDVGCTIDTIHCIDYMGVSIGQYDYYTRPISTWRDAEIAEIARHRRYFGAESAIDISTMSMQDQTTLSGLDRQSRKYDILTTNPFRDLVEVKFGQAYIEDYTV